MVKKAQSVNRNMVGETSYTYGEKTVHVIHSVTFTDKGKRALEDKITNELFDIFSVNSR